MTGFRKLTAHVMTNIRNSVAIGANGRNSSLVILRSGMFCKELEREIGCLWSGEGMHSSVKGWGMKCSSLKIRISVYWMFYSWNGVDCIWKTRLVRLFKPQLVPSPYNFVVSTTNLNGKNLCTQSVNCLLFCTPTTHYIKVSTSYLHFSVMLTWIWLFIMVWM